MNKHIGIVLLCSVALLSFQVSAKKYIPVRFGNEITILIPVDEAPVAQPDAVTIDEDTSVSLRDLILSNDTDENPGSLQITITYPADLASLNGTLDPQTLIYTPPENDFGPMLDTFDYYLTDEKGKNSEVVNVSINVEPVNDAPYQKFFSAFDTIQEDTVLNQSAKYYFDDIDNDYEDFDVVAGEALRGTVTIHDNNTITYTPNLHMNSRMLGPDRVTLWASDGTDTGRADIDIFVEKAPDPTQFDINVEHIQAWKQLKVSGTITDPDYGIISAQLELTGPVTSQVTLSLDANGYFEQSFSGIDEVAQAGYYTLNFTGQDRQGEYFNWSTSFAVNNNNSQPVAVNDIFYAEKDGQNIELDIMQNDFDIDGDNMTITHVTDSRVSINNGQTVVIDGSSVGLHKQARSTSAQQAGVCEIEPLHFNYTITDSGNLNASAGVSVFLRCPQAPNSPPPPTSLSVSKSLVNVDEALTLNWSGNASFNYKVYVSGPETKQYYTPHTTQNISMGMAGDYIVSVSSCTANQVCSSAVARNVKVVSREISDIAISFDRINPGMKAVLRWNQNTSTSGVAYQVQQIKNGSEQTIASNYAQKSLVLQPTSTGMYQYKVKACTQNNSNDCGHWSGVVSLEVTNDPIPVKVSYTYDALGRLIMVQDPFNGSRDYELDDAGNRTAVSTEH